MKYSTASSGQTRLVEIFVIKWFEPEETECFAYQYQLTWDKCRFIADYDWEDDLVVVHKLIVNPKSQEYLIALKNNK